MHFIPRTELHYKNILSRSFTRTDNKPIKINQTMYVAHFSAHALDKLILNFYSHLSVFVSLCVGCSYHAVIFDDDVHAHTCLENVQKINTYKKFSQVKDLIGTFCRFDYYGIELDLFF